MEFDTKMLSASEEDISLAADMLAKGMVVGIPTETVYGLAADALDPSAVSDIFKAKGRPQDNPLIVHVAPGFDLEKMQIVRKMPETAKLLMEQFWYG